ncbi:hypothetical protein [Aeromonas media]|uniref:hypothetical protein n=1 Tax=Aeromonas media TaxID=651 RepID=UPI003D059582
MINYIVLNGKSEAVKEIYLRARNVLNDNITFNPSSWTSKISGGGQWAYIACADAESELISRVISKPSGICLVNGPALRLNDRTDVAEAGLEAAGKQDAESIFDDIAGSYNLVSITSKNGLIAFGDFSGTCPIYYTSIDGVTCISNRASALHNLKPKGEYNKFSMSWLIGHSNVFGDETPFAGINRITAGSYIKSAIGSSNINLHKFKNQVWPASDDLEYIEDLSESEWDLIVEELVKNFRAANDNLDGQLRLSLTGGKDSRLVLALAIGAGLKDNVVTYTNGPEGSPEISCAKNIADLIGVPHQSNIRKTQVIAQDFEDSWQKLRYHTFRMESYICPWDGATAGVLKGKSSDMTGFGGELYRGPGGHAKQFKNLSFLKNKDAILSQFINYHQKMDPINILSELYKNAQIGWFYNWLEENSKAVRFDVLPEKFFVENRLSNWNGPLAQNVIGRVKFMPLLSPKVARLVFKLSPESRNKEVFHYTVMAKLAPDLISMPFLNATWDKSLQGRYGLDISDKPFDSHVKFNPRKVQAWQAEFVESQKEKIIHLLMMASRHTSIDDIFDTKKLCDFIERKDEFSNIEIKTILSSINLANTYLKSGQKVTDLI